MLFASVSSFLALIFILTVHECGHAFVAYRLGDPTAQRAGRLSLNPLRHLDPLGTFLIFFAGIGWGKPVPVDPRNFEHPMRDQALTALAGPATNLIVAVIAGLLYKHLPLGPVQEFSGAVLDLSLLLGIFNMLPFPPLDGSKFYSLFLPLAWQAKYHHYLDRGAVPFLIFMVVDIYLLPQILGFSLIWTAVSNLIFWLKTAILILV